MSANRVNIRLARVEDAEMIGAFVRRLTREHVARDFLHRGGVSFSEPLALRESWRVCVEPAAISSPRSGGKCLASSPLATTIICSCYSSRKRPRARGWRVPSGHVREACLEAGYSRLHCQRGAGAVPVYQRFGFVASGPVTTEHGVTRLPMTTR